MAQDALALEEFRAVVKNRRMGGWLGVSTMMLNPTDLEPNKHPKHEKHDSEKCQEILPVRTFRNEDKRM